MTKMAFFVFVELKTSRFPEASEPFPESEDKDLRVEETGPVSGSVHVWGSPLQK